MKKEQDTVWATSISGFNLGCQDKISQGWKVIPESIRIEMSPGNERYFALVEREIS